MLDYLGSMPTAPREVPNVIIERHVAVILTTARPDPREPAQPVPSTRRAVRILEFDARGLVRRIVDYPW
jgi:hypothetical protein